MNINNFKHKCDSCQKHISTCDSLSPLFAEDKIKPSYLDIPGDTVLWCDSYIEKLGEAGE